MNNNLLQIIRFIALVATQVLVLNEIQFGGYFNPYIYILFIILLPLRTPSLVMIFSGFILGLIIDFYSGMMGIHTAATLFISYFRNRIIRLVLGVTENDFLQVPGLRDLGIFRFVYYASVMILIHHTILFYLEVFSFHNTPDTLLRILGNSLISLVFTVVTLIIFERKKHER